MRRISEMYERSGRCDYRHACGECNYIRIETSKTRWGHRQQESSCELYKQIYGTATWNTKWGACKFFRDKRQKPEQLNIWDYIKEDI